MLWRSALLYYKSHGNIHIFMWLSYFVAEKKRTPYSLLSGKKYIKKIRLKLDLEFHTATCNKGGV